MKYIWLILFMNIGCTNSSEPDNYINELFSMDGSKFVLSNASKDVIILTREVIAVIGGMLMGTNELEKFLADYPDARLYLFVCKKLH